MPNVTISIPENLLRAGREYAKKHRDSLNGLIRKLLQKTVMSSPKDKDGELSELFHLMDEAKLDSKGKKWRREDLYDV